MTHTDEHGLPVGRPLPGWTPRPPIGPVTLTGRTCRIVPWDGAHAEELHRALDEQSDPTTWAYYPAGPYDDSAGLADWLDSLAAQADVQPHTVVSADGRPVGTASWMRITPAHGSAEVGSIVLADELKQSTAATEAMVLMAGHVMDDLGYRRYEWKCDSHNAPSRRAAARLGFSWEGTFRNAVVYRGRNRDSEWYSFTAEEWPALRTEYARWLDPANFDADGRQRTRLDTAAALGHPPVLAPQDR